MISDFSGQKKNVPVEHMDMKFKRLSIKLPNWLDIFVVHIVFNLFLAFTFVH